MLTLNYDDQDIPVGLKLLVDKCEHIFWRQLRKRDWTLGAYPTHNYGCITSLCIKIHEKRMTTSLKAKIINQNVGQTNDNYSKVSELNNTVKVLTLICRIWV